MADDKQPTLTIYATGGDFADRTGALDTLFGYIVDVGIPGTMDQDPDGDWGGVQLHVQATGDWSGDD